MTNFLNRIKQNADGINIIPAASNPQFEQLNKDLLTQALKSLGEKVDLEFNTLKERQKQVRDLHRLIQEIHTMTDDKGEFDCGNSENLQNLFQQARDLNIPIEEDKIHYTQEERHRLIENIRMTLDDLNTQNDLQLRTLTRLMDERYEAYQMAKSIYKPLHDAKIAMARASK